MFIKREIDRFLSKRMFFWRTQQRQEVDLIEESATGLIFSSAVPWRLSSKLYSASYEGRKI
jgi:hypothetical protein